MPYSPVPLTAAEIALDHTPITFGKYAGQTPDEVSESDPGYIVWMYDSVKNKPTCSRTLADICRADKHYYQAEKDSAERELNPDEDLYL